MSDQQARLKSRLQKGQAPKQQRREWSALSRDGQLSHVKLALTPHPTNVVDLELEVKQQGYRLCDYGESLDLGVGARQVDAAAPGRPRPPPDGVVWLVAHYKTYEVSIRIQLKAKTAPLVEGNLGHFPLAGQRRGRSVTKLPRGAGVGD